MTTKTEYKFLDIIEECACNRSVTAVKYMFLEYSEDGDK